MSNAFIRSLCSIVVEPLVGDRGRLQLKNCNLIFFSHCFICLYFYGASRFNIERNCFLSGGICIHDYKGCPLTTLTRDFSIYPCRWRFPVGNVFISCCPRADRPPSRTQQVVLIDLET